MRLARASLPAVAALALLLPGNGPPPRTHVVVNEQMHFGTVPGDIKVGDVVRWENRDLFRHSATARDRSFDVDLPAGASRTMVLRKAGAFAFYCKFHPGMTGTVTVRQ